MKWRDSRWRPKGEKAGLPPPESQVQVQATHGPITKAEPLSPTRTCPCRQPPLSWEAHVPGGLCGCWVLGAATQAMPSSRCHFSPVCLLVFARDSLCEEVCVSLALCADPCSQGEIRKGKGMGGPGPLVPGGPSSTCRGGAGARVASEGRGPPRGGAGCGGAGGGMTYSPSLLPQGSFLPLCSLPSEAQRRGRGGFLGRGSDSFLLPQRSWLPLCWAGRGGN